MKTNKNFLIWALIFFGMFLAINMGGSGVQHAKRQELAFSDFMNEAEQSLLIQVHQHFGIFLYHGFRCFC